MLNVRHIDHFPVHMMIHFVGIGHPKHARSSTITIGYILWPWRPNNSLQVWHPSGVTYVTLLLSFAMGHFMMHIMTHFDGIDHWNILKVQLHQSDANCGGGDHLLVSLGIETCTRCDICHALAIFCYGPLCDAYNGSFWRHWSLKHTQISIASFGCKLWPWWPLASFTRYRDLHKSPIIRVSNQP